MKAIYYMPLLIKEWAERENNTRIVEYSDLFNLLNPNACIIDRTESFDIPFETKVLFPIPKKEDFTDLKFADECTNRAIEVLRYNQPIKILYSGGLDSTTVLLSFFSAIKAGYGSFDQVSVAATPFSIIENPVAWEQYVLPNFKLEFAGDAFAGMADPTQANVRYINGENGDQLFGSDVLLMRMYLFNTPITEDTVRDFVQKRGVRPSAVPAVTHMMMKLYANRVTELNTMADLIWWLNFSSKWQSVALRYLAFTNFLQAGDDLSSLDRLATFFNTSRFQWLSLFGKMAKWGISPAATNYKLEMRKFLATFPGLEKYAETKIKVPSLYRLFSIEPAKYSVLVVNEEGKLQPLNTIEDLL